MRTLKDKILSIFVINITLKFTLQACAKVPLFHDTKARDDYHEIQVSINNPILSFIILRHSESSLPNYLLPALHGYSSPILPPSPGCDSVLLSTVGGGQQSQERAGCSSGLCTSTGAGRGSTNLSRSCSVIISVTKLSFCYLLVAIAAQYVTMSVCLSVYNEL